MTGHIPIWPVIVCIWAASQVTIVNTVHIAIIVCGKGRQVYVLIMNTWHTVSQSRVSMEGLMGLARK